MRRLVRARDGRKADGDSHVASPACNVVTRHVARRYGDLPDLQDTSPTGRFREVPFSLSVCSTRHLCLCSGCYTRPHLPHGEGVAEHPPLRGEVAPAASNHIAHSQSHGKEQPTLKTRSMAGGSRREWPRLQPARRQEASARATTGATHQEGGPRQPSAAPGASPW